MDHRMDERAGDPAHDDLEAGREAVAAGDWLAAGHAFVRAAAGGSAEGADLAVRVVGGLVPLADAGSADAAALIAGILLEHSDGSALPTAAAYARAAADARHPAGQRTYGHLLANGLGVPADPVTAKALFRAAAEAGDAYAAFDLGRLSDDFDEALALLRTAAEQGVEEAGAVLADRLAAADRDEEALGWYLWAAGRGHVGAMHAAASWYRDGFGTAPDPVEAARWFLVMFAHGDGDGVHEAIALVKAGALDAEGIRRAGRLAGTPGAADALLPFLP
ncbi:tetratricopeptide repeat protein [Streptomyces termitum]|uniref:tetratricopeptide repeat protein n=1 Tax=Streptomyces termitum TaxID=67368 RepID=UPI00339F2C30